RNRRRGGGKGWGGRAEAEECWGGHAARVRYLRSPESRPPLGAIRVNIRHRHTRRMGVLQNFLHLQLQLRDRLRRLRWRILVIGRSKGSQQRKKNGSTPQFLHDRPLPSRGQEGRTGPVCLIYTPKLLVRPKFARHPPFGVCACPFPA